jgi:hypothetical protein
MRVPLCRSNQPESVFLEVLALLFPLTSEADILHPSRQASSIPSFGNGTSSMSATRPQLSTGSQKARLRSLHAEKPRKQKRINSPFSMLTRLSRIAYSDKRRLKTDIRPAYQDRGFFYNSQGQLRRRCPFPNCQGSYQNNGKKNSTEAHWAMAHTNAEGRIACPFEGCRARKTILPTSYGRHLETIHIVGPIPCPDCGYLLSRENSSLNRHRKSCPVLNPKGKAQDDTDGVEDAREENLTKDESSGSARTATEPANELFKDSDEECERKDWSF